MQFKMSKQSYFEQFSFEKFQFLNVKTVSSQPTQFNSIWHIDKNLSGATAPGQSGPGSDGKEGVLRIPKSSSITGASPSDYLVLYPGHSFGGGSYLSAEKQSVYSTAPSRLDNLFVKYSYLI